jgi:hypothetical protein
MSSVEGSSSTAGEPNLASRSDLALSATSLNLLASAISSSALVLIASSAAATASA